MNLSQEERFKFYKNLGANFNKVLDIGAYEGEWKQMFQNLFPNSEILMIEANQEKEKILKSKGNYFIGLLGSEDNKLVTYYKCDSPKTPQTGNSVFLENTSYAFVEEKRKTIKLSSVPNIQEKYDLIKIDVQGSELEVIKGGLEIVKKSNFLLLELSLIEYNQKAPLVNEVMDFLKKIDFELIDIFDIHYYKNMTSQFDGFFKNKNFNSNYIKGIF
jgi:FkbM family methyltransferase